MYPIKLIIDGTTSQLFSAETLPPFPHPDESHRGTTIRVSRERYASRRAAVEEKIAGFIHL